MLIYPLIALITFAGLLYGIKIENQRLVYVFKPLTSLLFVLAAWQGGLASTCHTRLFIGLVLCMIGDIALIPKQRAWFLIGLLSFLLGHVTYIFAFSALIVLTPAGALVAVIIVALDAACLGWLAPHLKNMRIPIVVYMLVISVMVWSAWGVFFTSHLPLTARLLIATGATCFCISDVFVAKNRFTSYSFKSRATGLALYYVGQFLLAWSLSTLR